VHRLHARELDTPELGVSPREHGSAVHRALDLVWRELKSQEELKSRSPEELSHLIRACAREALERVPEPFRALEQARLERLIAEWLQIEGNRPPFEVIEIETAARAEIAGLNLQIRADRVDRYLSGGHAILDYKTSKDISVRAWEGDRPDEPQLPLYAVKSGYNVTEAYFVKLASGGVERLGGDITAKKRDWERVLGKLASDFLAGRAAVDPKKRKQTCAFCKLGSLCRVGELNGAEIEAGVPDE